MGRQKLTSTAVQSRVKRRTTRKIVSRGTQTVTGFTCRWDPLERDGERGRVWCLIGQLNVVIIPSINV